MVNTIKQAMHSKLPVSLDMYESMYRKDYQWCEQYKHNKEDVQKLQIADSKLKAKEFGGPWKEWEMSYSSGVEERREILPPPRVKASSGTGDARWRKLEGSNFDLRAFQQREHITSEFPAVERYHPKYIPATKEAAVQTERLEKLSPLTEPENRMSCCQTLPLAAQTAGTAGMLPHRPKLSPCWATYQQFNMEMHQATLRDAEQNRRKVLGSSVLQEGFELGWTSTYNTDFQHRPGARGEYCGLDKNLSHVFHKDEHFNENHWVSEYRDSYSICLRKLKWSSQIPAVGLHSGKRLVMDTGQ